MLIIILHHNFLARKKNTSPKGVQMSEEEMRTLPSDEGEEEVEQEDSQEEGAEEPRQKKKEKKQGRETAS